MGRKEYNGWTNYETWLAALYLDDEYYSERAQDLAREVIDRGHEDAEAVRKALVRDLAQEMEGDHVDARPKNTGLYSDLLTSAMNEINWSEIANHFATDVTLWAAGWNMPGYMPDSDPAIFVDHDDALGHIGYAFDDEEESEELDSAREELDACRGEYGVTVGKYHYWITKV